MSRPLRFNRSAIMTRAWELARTWHAAARSFHFNRQQERPRVALRLDQPAPFIGKVRDHFAEALRRAWAEARPVRETVMSSEIAAARHSLIIARMIDSTRVALPAIAAAEARLAFLNNASLRN
jgi:hypothetical protein